MMLLGIHFLAITLLVTVVWTLGHRAGRRREAQRWQRHLERHQAEGRAPLGGEPPTR